MICNAWYGGTFYLSSVSFSNGDQYSIPFASSLNSSLGIYDTSPFEWATLDFTGSPIVIDDISYGPNDSPGVPEPSPFVLASLTTLLSIGILLYHSRSRSRFTMPTNQVVIGEM